MLSLLSGNTWYGQYGFRPIKIQNNKYVFDEFEKKKYEENKKIMETIKVTDFDLLKFISMTKNESLISATKKIIQKMPDMLLKDFLSNHLQEFDKTCKYFAKFYEHLYNKISVYDPHRKFYGLAI